MQDSADIKVLYFATGNRHKFREAEDVLKRYGLRLIMTDVRPFEVQHKDLRVIALTRLKDALAKSGKSPLLAEDAGLFIKALKGFPGVYSSYVYETIGLKGVLRLIEEVEDRSAVFKSAVAFTDSKGLFKTFLGKVEGTITDAIRGVGGFGFDPIFIPKGSSRTYGEITLREKSRSSHRAEAFRKLAEWYTVNILRR